MTDLRTAAQQALGLICSARLCEVNSMSSRQEMLRLLIEATDILRAALAQQRLTDAQQEMERSIESLKAALAQQAEPVEPVAWANIDSDRLRVDPATGNVSIGAQQAEPVEPVAGRAFLERILTAMEGVIDVADRKTDEFDALRSCVIDLTLMLHTAPPQRKPLTEEEIERLWYPSTVIAEPGKRRVAFGRAVERAHGIGDNT